MEKLEVMFPGYVLGRKYPISYVLRKTEYKEGDSADIFDLMIQAADYITMLEERVESQEEVIAKIRESSAGKLLLDYT